MLVKAVCLECSATFFARQDKIDKGLAKFCSRTCSNTNSSHRRKPTGSSVNCSYCGTAFYLQPHEILKSKTKLFFCCFKHRIDAMRDNKYKKLLSPKTGTGQGLRDYRQSALSFFPKQCSRCGYKKYVEVLEINHKDLDRSNNKISNLEVLCPTCHEEFHFLSKTGKWYQHSSPKMKVVWPNKDVLLERLKSVRKSVLAREIGVSHNGLNKHLIKLGINFDAVL